MALKHISAGFAVKLITGLDDSMIHIPIVANMTKTKIGRIAFSIGILLAITLAIIVSFLFASSLKLFPYYNYLSAGLIFALAATVYFDVLIHKPKKKLEEKLKNKKPPVKTLKESDKQKGLIKKIKKISLKRFLKLIGIGLITAIATVIDDTIAYSSLFLNTRFAIFIIMGIYLATIAQLTAIIYFSKKIQKIPYKKEITTMGLIILGFLIFYKVI
ncbi:hypothetical protein GF386_04255 [Candidatus Pacearchaeota archaeon]|nr:hypothetical protein [Candidatus Pacearchaeota archaeon]MBD3283337.1 hypothetical protein [Candidatus Pacearchaeota archaeon]